MGRLMLVLKLMGILEIIISHFAASNNYLR